MEDDLPDQPELDEPLSDEMAEEQAREEYEQRMGVLSAVGETISKLRDEAVKGRAASGIEQEWLEDEEHYEGIDDAKYLVTIDPLATETSTFWQNHGEYNNVDPAKIQAEVFRLPSTCFAEEDGFRAASRRSAGLQKVSG